MRIKYAQHINDDIHLVDGEDLESECGLNMSSEPLKRYLWPRQINCPDCLKRMFSSFSDGENDEQE